MGCGAYDVAQGPARLRLRTDSHTRTHATGGGPTKGRQPSATTQWCKPSILPLRSHSQHLRHRTLCAATDEFVGVSALLRNGRAHRGGTHRRPTALSVRCGDGGDGGSDRGQHGRPGTEQRNISQARGSGSLATHDSSPRAEGAYSAQLTHCQRLPHLTCRLVKVSPHPSPSVTSRPSG